jgi:hypothetical protein
MPYINIVISEEAKKYLQRRAGRKRGMGCYVNALLLKDEMRFEAQMLEKRLQEHGISTKELWALTGCRVD